MRVGLTGTPGVGKTTLAGLLDKRGWRVVDVKEWAHAEGCVVGFDEEMGTDVVDVTTLRARVPPDDGTDVVYESHLSHYLGLDEVWVLRCDPDVLRVRLEARGYSPDKVRENLEAEAIDLILSEALEEGGRVVQRDATHRSPQELLSSLLATRGGSGHDLERVDWSDRLPV